MHQVGRGRDNSQRGVTDEPILEAYKLDGTFLWRINLGKNIREGAHYTQFIVYDLDGDGRAEVVCKTADGTVDGAGKVIGDANADHRNADGYVLERPGVPHRLRRPHRRGAGDHAVHPPRHPRDRRADAEQQQAAGATATATACDRFLAVRRVPRRRAAERRHVPRLLHARRARRVGLARRQAHAPLDVRQRRGPESNRAYRGQGNHSLSVADVDGDGKDEIVYGACVIDDDGKGLYSTGLGHGDALHVSDLDPTRPGLEVFGIQERFGDAGVNFRDARTGEVALEESVDPRRRRRRRSRPRHLVRHRPAHRGAESWVAGAGFEGVWNAKGEQISDKQAAARATSPSGGTATCCASCSTGTSSPSGTGQPSGTDTLFVAADGCASNNGTKATPVLSADILGDWREEVILRVADDPRELRIYTTTIPTEHRLPR